MKLDEALFQLNDLACQGLESQPGTVHLFGDDRDEAVPENFLPFHQVLAGLLAKLRRPEQPVGNLLLVDHKMKRPQLGTGEQGSLGFVNVYIGSVLIPQVLFHDFAKGAFARQ